MLAKMTLPVRWVNEWEDDCHCFSVHSDSIIAKMIVEKTRYSVHTFSFNDIYRVDRPRWIANRKCSPWGHTENTTLPFRFFILFQLFFDRVDNVDMLGGDANCEGWMSGENRFSLEKWRWLLASVLKCLPLSNLGKKLRSIFDLICKKKPQVSNHLNVYLRASWQNDALMVKCAFLVNITSSAMRLPPPAHVAKPEHDWMPFC